MKSILINRTSRLKTGSASQLLWTAVVVCTLFTGGCAVSPKTLAIADHAAELSENTIFETASASVISQEHLIDQLAGVQVVYVGESHTNPSHHAIQLAVIQALAETTPELIIGMEMFDTTYQQVLDRWVNGELDETSFLQLTHWYANWRYDYGLYRDILEFAKEKKLRVVALNVPTYISSRIRVGGIASLSADDRRHLPATIDTTNADHRAYLEEIFSMHRFSGRSSFDFFYEAQCTWEDAMADRVARNLGTGKMVVLAGNGHIIRKFGIPNRAFARNGAPFKTVYLASVGSQAETSWADYLWVTPEQRMPRRSMRAGAKTPQ
jgi:uncharacterized iron-regulated protein